MKPISITGILVIGTIPLYAAEADLLTYDLEDLSQIAITESVATLTPTDPKELPATVTTITSEQIKYSGARNLDELLEIYVPGFTYMYKAEGNQMGIRGIISDRNNKILLLVNGKKMNIMASDGGAVTERWFTMLGDIRRITVINGPGSAVYGAGAIAGVINIETFDGSESEGLEVTLKEGMGETFSTFEMRYSHTFDEGGTLFGYFGVDHDEGADEGKAPHKLAFSAVNLSLGQNNHIPITANEPLPMSTTNDNASYHNKPRYKIHLQYTDEDFKIWTRYTRSALAIPTVQGLYVKVDPERVLGTGVMNQQWTTVGSYSWDISESWSLDLEAGYKVSDNYIDIIHDDQTKKNWREEEASAKLLLHYIPEDENEQFAVGTEYLYTHFGDKAALDDTSVSYFGQQIPEGTKWHSSMFSLFGEYQTHLNETWTLFAGLRMDKHTYSDWMLSPRLSAVYMPDTLHTYKLIYNRSVRHSDDAELYKYYMENGENGDVETIDNVEFIVDYYPGKTWHLSLSTYFNHHKVVAYNDATKKTEYIGTVNFYGLEGVVHYHTEQWDIALSHSFTKELDFTLDDPDITRQNISASVYGYGDDLANWYDHMTKLVVGYVPNREWRWDTSLRIMWGMPGAIDMADYNMDYFSDNLSALLRLPLYDDGTDAFETAIYLDTSVTWYYNNQVEFSLYGYNLIGLFDQTYNKRNYFQRTSHYREAAPALSLRMTYRFE